MLEEKDSIRELLAHYCFCYDEAQFDRWIELWTDDPVFDVDGRMFLGRAGLNEFIEAAVLVDGKPPLKHYVMNEIISVDGDTATARCYLLVVRKSSTGALLAGSAGTYEDELIKKDGRWYFRKRTVRRDFRYEREPHRNTSKRAWRTALRDATARWRKVSSTPGS
jgi:ketosteroid isomerase-like protein